MNAPNTGADVPLPAAARVGHDPPGQTRLRQLAEEQAALRRVATLVAGGAQPTEVFTAVADELGRKPSSVSPARDGLIKKGLIYSSERGLIAFTVPHFGKFLRSQPV